MPDRHLTIGVVVAGKTLRSGSWGQHVWLPHAILPSAPAAAAGARLGGDDKAAYVYAGAFDLCLHRAATSHYRDNLVSPRPAIWIALQDSGEYFEIGTVTADPYEGEALTEGIGMTVEAVPMPENIQAAVWAFVAAFHVERPFVKRKRDRAATDARRRSGPEAIAHGR